MMVYGLTLKVVCETDASAGRATATRRGVGRVCHLDARLLWRLEVAAHASSPPPPSVKDTIEHEKCVKHTEKKMRLLSGPLKLSVSLSSIHDAQHQNPVLNTEASSLSS